MKGIDEPAAKDYHNAFSIQKERLIRVSKVSWGSNGPYFEDFGIDVTYKHWPGRTISQEDNVVVSTARWTSPRCTSTKSTHGIPSTRLRHEPEARKGRGSGNCVKDTTRNAVANLGTEYENLSRYSLEIHYTPSPRLSRRGSHSPGPYAGISTWIHEGFDQKGDKIYESKRSNLVYKTSSSPWAKMLHNGDGK